VQLLEDPNHAVRPEGDPLAHSPAIERTDLARQN
jgi:hypothetical protein